MLVIFQQVIAYEMKIYFDSFVKYHDVRSFVAFALSSQCSKVLGATQNSIPSLNHAAKQPLKESFPCYYNLLMHWIEIVVYIFDDFQEIIAFTSLTQYPYINMLMKEQKTFGPELLVYT